MLGTLGWAGVGGSHPAGVPPDWPAPNYVGGPTTYRLANCGAAGGMRSLKFSTD